MVTRNPLQNPNRHYRLLVEGGGKDHTLGEAIVPGARSWGHRPENRVQELPARARTYIEPGDFVTRSKARTGDNPWTAATETASDGAWLGTLSAGYMAHPVSVTESVTAPAELGWGDMSGGIYQALNFVDNMAGGDGAQGVSVYGAPALVECFLESGMSVGDKCGCDLRPYNTSATDYADPTAAQYVDDLHDQYSGDTGTTEAALRAAHRRSAHFFMRVRKMTAANLADDDISKAFVGQLVEIVTPRSLPNESSADKAYSYSTNKNTSGFQDVGYVQLGVGR